MQTSLFSVDIVLCKMFCKKTRMDLDGPGSESARTGSVQIQIQSDLNPSGSDSDQSGLDQHRSGSIRIGIRPERSGSARAGSIQIWIRPDQIPTRADLDPPVLDLSRSGSAWIIFRTEQSDLTQPEWILTDLDPIGSGSVSVRI
jgi:hypothetical protein